MSRNVIRRLGGIRDGHFLSPNSKSLRCVRFPARTLPVSDEYSVLGLTPLSSRTDVKRAYKRLALKYHPDVIRGENGHRKQEIFKEIKYAYESLMEKFEEGQGQDGRMAGEEHYDEYDEWDEWMGFEGGIPVIYNPS
eukprot:TRINITY_DN5194_c0_g3_i1.p1 TRINITY_DN5194_c0_g3~~TRINITY_DN5194_c0_g3_i1.p1  ORF type:complete len:137 (-),score=21.93 TRINITY_DN5194_c0_g3_i1:130-540(-)